MCTIIVSATRALLTSSELRGVGWILAPNITTLRCFIVSNVPVLQSLEDVCDDLHLALCKAVLEELIPVHLHQSCKAGTLLGCCLVIGMESDFCS
jgi:hypothetical protein